jgi:DNA-3-methyladenine glycosylase II
MKTKIEPFVNSIKTEQDIIEGLEMLGQLDETLLPVIKQTPFVPLRREQSGFPGLVRIIIGQHVSTASASAIHGRFVEAIYPITPKRYLEIAEEILIQIGLTRAKQATITNLANVIMDGTLDLEEINQLEESQAVAKLTALKGIGPWTAEVYLLFCAGHPDIFAAGDLALREAVRHAYDMEERPSENELREIATKWAPFRGIATRLFWSYYEHVKGNGKGQPL